MRGITSCCFLGRLHGIVEEAFDARSDWGDCSSTTIGRRPEAAQAFQPAGFYWSGFLCRAVAVLKLTVEAQWSWWRVLLPFWAVLGHNLLYLTVGFAWLYFAGAGATEEAVTIRQGHSAYGYQIGALACFAVLMDNVLRRIEGQEETIFLWVRSGGWEVIFVFGVLSVVLQLLFWSDTVDLGDRRTHRK